MSIHSQPIGVAGLALYLAGTATAGISWVTSKIMGSVVAVGTVDDTGKSAVVLAVIGLATLLINKVFEDRKARLDLKGQMDSLKADALQQILDIRKAKEASDSVIDDLRAQLARFDKESAVREAKLEVAAKALDKTTSAVVKIAEHVDVKIDPAPPMNGGKGEMDRLAPPEHSTLNPR